jgi:hypothetical protein
MHAYVLAGRGKAAAAASAQKSNRFEGNNADWRKLARNRVKDRDQKKVRETIKETVAARDAF